MRVVVDTNIWISVLLRGRSVLPILSFWQQDLFELIMSQSLLDELNEVWQRPKLQKYIRPAQAQQLLHQIKRRGVFVELVTTPPQCRDPKDDPVLATAIDGQAALIVTGDKDLLADVSLQEAMLSFDVEIWRIHTFLQFLQNNESSNL